MEIPSPHRNANGMFTSVVAKSPEEVPGIRRHRIDLEDREAHGAAFHRRSPLAGRNRCCGSLLEFLSLRRIFNREAVTSIDLHRFRPNQEPKEFARFGTIVFFNDCKSITDPDAVVSWKLTKDLYFPRGCG